jgi:tetratricopeptide (TPR) repeat protein
VYSSRGRIADARALYEEARRGAEALNGGRTTALAEVLNDFASLDVRAGDFGAAERKHRQALALASDLVGPDSFQVADTLNDLAVVLASQGRVREAAEAFEESYKRHVALFGERHWRTLNTMRNIGVSRFLLDDPAACERWLRAAVEGHEGARTRDRFTIYVRAQLARCVLRAGRTDEGIRQLSSAVDELHREGAEAADYHASVQLWLGTALLEAGQVERAVPLVTTAVEHKRRTRSPDHPARAEAECELAHVLAARHRFDEALSIAETCVPRIVEYGQMVPWRRQAAQQLLQRLRSDARR